MLKFEQLSLDLFPAPSFGELIARDGRDGLSVRISSRLKSGWYVKTRRGDHLRDLVVPAYLEKAPENVKLALIDWAQLPRARSRGRAGPHQQRRKEIESFVMSYIESLGIERHRGSRVDPAILAQSTAGGKFDLKEAFDYLNIRYFGNAVKSYLRWGRYGSALSYQTFKTDRHGNRFSIITIAGVYDHPAVPEYALQGVVYHEMLHLVVPPEERDGHRMIHGPAFKAAEKQFEHFSQWRAWERNELRRLVRSMKRKRKRRA